MSVKTTQKKIYAGADVSEETLMRHIDSGITNVFKKPWHRLERGFRLNRLRAFTENEAQKMNLSAAESAALVQVLSKALDKKILNSKTTVIYDFENETITEIKGLIMHRGSDGIMRFQLVEKKAAMTFRKRKTDSAAPAAAPQENLN
jgi:hypothetical protein